MLFSIKSKGGNSIFFSEKLNILWIELGSNQDPDAAGFPG